MLERIRGAGVELHDVDGQLRVVGTMTAMQRDWVKSHKAALLEALRVERETPSVCATCQRVIALGVEDWRYRELDGAPLCQACCERTDAEMATYQARRDSAER